VSPLLELVDVTKRFGDLVALSAARLEVRPGTVHALLGENGAGKTTLMRLAFGMLRPDGGTIRVRGRAVAFRSPVDALACGIGMVHQHFTLVPAMTVAENIALGGSGRYRKTVAVNRVSTLVEQTGLPVPQEALIRDLAVGAQQRVEILKAMARDVRILVLDEPTAVLAPGEVEEFLRWVRAFPGPDRAIILITHKLREAIAVADDVTVLRGGRTVFAGTPREAGEAGLVAAMLGEQLTEAPSAEPTHAKPRRGPVVLRLRDVGVIGARDRTVLRSVTLDVHAGELLGIAAVEGAGQHELLRVLAGRLGPSSGAAECPPDVAFIPEDRHRDAVVLDFTLTENLALRGLGQRRGRLPWADLRARTRKVLERFEVRASGPDVAIRTLSGGNQQKFIIGREFEPLPPAVVAENPTRGLDVRATRDVLAQLQRARDRGAAVVMYSSDADEVLAIADRIVVMHAGEARTVPVDREAVGRAMLGALA
jgi:simple sugar transport system ATP-binding protein